MLRILLLTALGAALCAAPAGAAVTASQITTPAGFTQRLNDGDSGQLGIAGTVTGAGNVELRCYHDEGSIPMGGPIAPTGTTFAKALSFEDVPTVPCIVRAVPAGTIPDAKPGSATPFAGVEIAISKIKRERVNGGGPNDGRTIRTYVDHVLPGTSGEQYETGACGLALLELHQRPGLERRAAPWGCNAYLASADRPIKLMPASRSEIVVDGRNAYLATHVLGNELFNGSKDLAGVPDTETSVALTEDGGLRFDDASPALRCATDAYPPTAASCGSVAGTGVEIRRSTRTAPDGSEVMIVDELRSVDGAEHRVDLLYENNPVGIPETRLPGDDYREHPEGTRVALPAGPGSLFLRDTRPPATNSVPVQGALTWKTAPSSYHQYRGKDFQLAFERTVPAGGVTTIVQVLSSAETDAEIERLAAGVRARLTDPVAPSPTPALPATPGPAVPRDRTPPTVSALKLSPARFRAARGTKVSWRVSEAGRTTLALERALPGRRSGGSCVKPTRRLRSRTTCTRFVAAGQVARATGAGPQRLTVKARFGARRLVPGAYRLRVSAADAAGNRTPRPKDARLTVMPARR